MRVSFELPDDVVPVLRPSPAAIACALRLAAAMFWYGRTELSHERAAELAGLSRIQFDDALAAAKQDVVVMDCDRLDRELDYLATASQPHDHP